MIVCQKRCCFLRVVKYFIEKLNLGEELRPIKCMCMSQYLTESSEKAVKKTSRFIERASSKTVNIIHRLP